MFLCENAMARTSRIYTCVIIVCCYAGYANAMDHRRYDGSATLESEASTGQAEMLRLLDNASLSLDDLLKATVLCNPEIAAAKNDIGAATGRLRQAGLYPNPIMEFEAEEKAARTAPYRRH